MPGGKDRSVPAELPVGALLAGKRVLVSGVGPGMGRDIAVLFARHGALLALGGRTPAKVEAVQLAVEMVGGRAVPVRLDVTDEASRQSAVATVKRELGGLDVVVNNAFDPGDFHLIEEASMEDWRRVFETNFFGTIALTQAVVPMLKESSAGRIVMVNTMSVIRIEERFGAYSASKAALASATKTMAKELGRYGIRVNAVHPGFIWGDSSEWYLRHRAEERGTTLDDEYERVASETSLGYLPHSSEIAGSVLFLASDLARPVTGQALGVNAGQVFQGV